MSDSDHSHSEYDEETPAGVHQSKPSLATHVVNGVESLVLDAIESTRPLELDPARSQLFELFVAAEEAGTDCRRQQRRSLRWLRRRKQCHGSVCRQSVPSSRPPLGPGHGRARSPGSANPPACRSTGTHASSVVHDANVDGMELRVATME